MATFRKFLVSGLIALLATSLPAAEPDVRVYAARSKAERYEALSTARATIDKIRKDRKRDRKERERAVAVVTTRIQVLEDPLAPFFAPGPDLKKASIGDVGHLTETHVTVFQVIDADNALVKFEWSVERDQIPRGGIEVGSAEDRQLEHRRRNYDRDYWLRGVSTDDAIDGHSFALDGFFAVTGTKTYPTAVGTKTVPVLEPYDIGTNQDLFTRRNELRTWTPASGQDAHEAIYLRYNRGKVTLKKLDGTEIDLRLSDLSEIDRDYVRERLAAERKSRP